MNPIITLTAALLLAPLVPHKDTWPWVLHDGDTAPIDQTWHLKSDEVKKLYSQFSEIQRKAQFFYAVGQQHHRTYVDVAAQGRWPDSYFEFPYHIENAHRVYDEDRRPAAFFEMQLDRQTDPQSRAAIEKLRELCEQAKVSCFQVTQTSTIMCIRLKGYEVTFHVMDEVDKPNPQPKR